MKKEFYLKTSPIFRDLSELSFENLNKISSLQHYKKNKLIICEKEAATGFWVVGIGTVKVYKLSEKGQTLIIKLAQPGNSIAEVAVLLENSIYPAFAQCLEDTELLFFPKEKFLNLIKNNAEIANVFLKMYAKIIYNFTLKMESFGLSDVKTRLLNYIQQNCISSKYGYFKINISKKILAELMGTIPETLSRAFSSLQKENKIQIENNKIYLL